MDALDAAARVLEPGGKNVERMTDLALVVSSWSSCPAGRQHGCVLAVDGRYVVATGYNGPPRGEDPCDCRGKPKDWCLKNCRAVHAEVNAVCNAAYVGARIRDCWAFVTKKPCGGCRGALKNAGLRGVVYLLPVEAGAPLEFDREMFRWSRPTSRRKPRP